MCLAACAPANDATDSIAYSASATPSEYHLAILEIIEDGNAAAKNADTEKLKTASSNLMRLGAHPLQAGAADLAANWLHLAQLNTDTAITPPIRGRVKGPAYRQDNLMPGARETFFEVYYATETAELTLKVSEGADLVLKIYEQAKDSAKPADLVCYIKAGAKPVTCKWTPLWTAKYAIEILNHGSAQTSYLLVTN